MAGEGQGESQMEQPCLPDGRLGTRRVTDGTPWSARWQVRDEKSHGCYILVCQMAGEEQGESWTEQPCLPDGRLGTRRVTNGTPWSARWQARDEKSHRWDNLPDVNQSQDGHDVRDRRTQHPLQVASHPSCVGQGHVQNTRHAGGTHNTVVLHICSGTGHVV